MKKKIGIVVQRYGVAVNGGAEVHARMIAERLAQHYEVVILTSQALDYTTWAPHYPAGWTQEENIPILRFDTTPRASSRTQEYWGRKMRGRHLPQKLHRLLGKPEWLLRLLPQAGQGREDGVQWLKAQGPYMPQLLEFMQRHENEFAAFVFFTALYYPTAMGVLTVPHKSILVPTMHDESAIYGAIYQEVMAAPRWILFNTTAEQNFSERLFPIGQVHKRIAGVGIERWADTLVPDTGVPLSFNIRQPYLIYVGRIDKAKGCAELIRFFLRYKKETGQSLQLVLVGKKFMPVQPHADLVLTGFVSDEVKAQLMLQAKALVMPSVYESLSLVLLESMGCRVPVIANGRTEVLRDHIEESGGGWHYADYESFKQAVHHCMALEEERRNKGAKGYDYVRARYSWEGVMQTYHEAIADIEQNSSPAAGQ